MKRTLSLFLAGLLFCCLWLPAAAEDLFDYSYMRFNDFAGVVSEEEATALNEKAHDRRDELQMDFPVCVFWTRQSTTTLSEFAADYYARNKFGCGADKSGILLVLDCKNAIYNIYYYGEADTLIDDVRRQTLSDSFKADCRNDALTYYQAFDRYYDAAYAMVEDARENPRPRTTEAETDADDGAMPDWYPENTEGFTDFHGEDLPPVVDDAHIFTDEQMQTLSDKISAMNARLGIGYAAFTSNDNHGLMPEEYSSDFLHFNGYGVGDGYGAVVFYLSLDPDDRCWLTTSINTYEPLFNASVTYEIDEMVDSSIRGGQYYEAFLMHADYVDALFSNLSENLPDWYPEGTRTYSLDRSQRTYAAKRNPDAPRIADNAGILTDAQKQSCSGTLQTLSQQYGLDIVFFTDSVSRAPEPEQYADDFYFYNGYAADGLVLYLVDGSYGTLYYGAAERYRALDIDADIRSLVGKDRQDEAVERYLELLTFMLERGRLPMHWGTALFCLIVGVIAGMITASAVLSKMKRDMRITTPISTQSYLVDGSMRVFGVSHHYLYSTVTKTAKPKPTESSGSSSGSSSRGGSTHTSGHSAGGSYSSGGRRF